MVSMLTAILRGAVIVLFTATCAEAKATVNNQVTLLEETNSSLLRYPTQFTQNIVPKNIHSHNDYWRDVPLLTALSYGVGSVEADVWLVNGTLYVGHEVAALTQDRTFASLYVQPLVKIIQGQNPKNVFTANQTQPKLALRTSPPGLLKADRTVQRRVGHSVDSAIEALPVSSRSFLRTLPWVLEALQPLRSQGFLTTYANGSLSTGPVTVVGTGNSPLEPIKALEPRDYFFDAPLTQLRDPSLNTTWDFTLSPLASTDYGTAVGWSGIGDISEAQRTNITKFVDDAHSFGIKARFWDTPGWPIQARDNVWRELVNDGADWLNADDLEAASQF